MYRIKRQTNFYSSKGSHNLLSRLNIQSIHKEIIYNFLTHFRMTQVREGKLTKHKNQNWDLQIQLR